MTVRPSAAQSILVRAAIRLSAFSLLPITAMAHHSRVEYVRGEMHEVDGCVPYY